MNNEDVNHDSWRDHASEYERGFIDGMQRQAQSSVDKAVNAMSAAQPAPVHGWINPNDKTQRRFLPDIGDKVLFCIGERVYYGHHTGGGFRTGQGIATKYFSTWDCHWMPIPPAHGIK
jgi:hypothetical protein